MTLPNFFIIGAPKCGTTSLQSYLAQHKDICFSKYKEPNFFAFDGERLPKNGPVSPELMFELIYFHSINNIDEYQKQFEHWQGEPVIGDASVRYLYLKAAAQRIKDRVPQAKMVAVLREPVSRLYSHYCMNRQYQIEPLSLMDAIDAEPQRIKEDWGWDWHYVNIGLYTEQIHRFYSLFDRQQLKIFLYDDFVRDPGSVVKEICEFVGVDASFKPDMDKKGKVAYLPRNLAFDRFLNRDNWLRSAIESPMSWKMKSKYKSVLMSLNSKPVPKIDPNLKKDLEKKFYHEVQNLEDLLGRKIPWYANKRA
jgi:hypothetical protein